VPRTIDLIFKTLIFLIFFLEVEPVHHGSAIAGTARGQRPGIRTRLRSQHLHDELHRHSCIAGQVTVGTALRRRDPSRPPYRSQRAGLLHWALISGSDVKALFRPRMSNAGHGKPPNCESMHSLPVESVALATSPKRLIPTFCHRLPKHLERVDVSRHPKVREVSADHGAEPTTLLLNCLVQTAAQFKSDLPNVAPQSRTHRATLQKELPTPRASAIMRQPEKVFYETLSGICVPGTYVAPRPFGRKMPDFRRFDDT
jgi:hypothetical protein